MPGARLLTFLSAVTVAATIVAFAKESVAQDRGGLTAYRNDRHGFSLSYPASQFLALPPSSEDGRAFISRDGNARLLVGTLPNLDGKTLRDYRSFVLAESYFGAQVDYAPVRDKWFVVSGTRNGMMFYQRVTFTCGGRSINSWAMLYPEAERGLYDRIVEQVAKSYRAGEGTCG